ncbi:MAG: XdhC family protein [Acidobacteria bacterium]|nr:XdhC family protein [Acidobacteriota bacterium]
MATVVGCQAPSSAKPGDQAIIVAGGKLSGWIGGGCAQPVVIREALRALADGKPRLICISPGPKHEELPVHEAPLARENPSNPGQPPAARNRTNHEELATREAASARERPSRPGVVDYTMSCHSGGELDIFIEPVLPNLHLVILGRSPVAETLTRLARDVGYTVSAVIPAAAEDNHDDDAERFAEVEVDVIRARDFDLSRIRIAPDTYLVVSTQGEGDEEALEQALRATGRDAPYLAFVASKTKAAKVFDYLRQKGIVEEKLRRVRVPAGLDLGARSPEEIAVSILAEIVQVRRARRIPRHDESPVGDAAPANPGARDPICGMTVDTTNAVHKLERQGTWFYFCCAGCKQKFEAEAALSS